MILNTLIIALSVIIIEKINEQDYSKRMVLFCYCFSEQNTDAIELEEHQPCT